MINEKIKETSVSRLFLHNFLRATGGLSSKRGKKNERFLSLNKQSVLPLLPCFLFFFPFFKFFHPKKEDRLTKKREQKTQSETALARTRANTGQALNGDNQTKTIFSRLIFDRSIYVPRSRQVRNRTHKQERRIITLDFFQFPPSCSPLLFSLLPKIDDKSRSKKNQIIFRKTRWLPRTRSDSLRANAGSHGDLGRFPQRNLRRNGSAG